MREADLDLWRSVSQNVVLTDADHGVSDIRSETVKVPMRDGVRLATDVYLPPAAKAPTVVVRTPYDRESDVAAATMLSLARRGYACVIQDCRGTGDSEPDFWDYYVREPEDGYDFIEWVTKQPWFDGFIGAYGGSYVGQVQWQMSMHPAMTTIVPEVSGLGVGINTAHLHLFMDAYVRAIGHGEDKTDAPIGELEKLFEKETLAGGFFNEPLYPEVPAAVRDLVPGLDGLSSLDLQRHMWNHYCSLPCADRAELVKRAMGSETVTIVDIEAMSRFFGQQISHDRHTLPHPDMTKLVRSLHAPALFSTGWYDWGLNDALDTWELLHQSAPDQIRDNSRLFIGPSTHNMPGYHEGMAALTELQHHYREGTAAHLELLLHWYRSIREDKVAEWAPVTFYLMGANEWRVADAWPLPGTLTTPLYLGEGGSLRPDAPADADVADSYVYDPLDPTPTVGGSIVSWLYPAGSVDATPAEERDDVLTYTTPPLAADFDVVGRLRFVLHASSSAVDTDFVVRLSDVFPDGRSIQLQNAMLRARYRNSDLRPELLEPGRVYEFEIDMWATANRFKAGHRIRIGIASADFPRFDRNANRGGEPGEPVPATQRIYRDVDHPSHLLMPSIDGIPRFADDAPA